MKTPLRPLVIGALLIAGLSLAMACGGGSERGSSQPADAADGESAVAPGGPATLAEPFQALDSFRYTLSLALAVEPTEDLPDDDLLLPTVGVIAFGLDIDGEYVAPDREHVVVHGDLFGLEMEEETITVEGRSWSRTPDTGWEERPGEFTAGEFDASSFLDWFDDSPLSGLEAQRETVSGVSTLHYSLNLDKGDLATLGALGAIFGGDTSEGELPDDLSFDIDLWLAEREMWPVRLEVAATGSDDQGAFELNAFFELRDINDASIRILPPA